MVDLSKALGYSIVAEGLETEQHLNTLTELAVDFGQGWHVGKPQSFAEVAKHVKSGA